MMIETLSRHYSFVTEPQSNLAFSTVSYCHLTAMSIKSDFRVNCRIHAQRLLAGLSDRKCDIL